jgi:hypothetical protein
MKRKWYKFKEMLPEEGAYHIWGERVGMHIADYTCRGEWIVDDASMKTDRFSHFMPFPHEPRRKRR